MTERTWPLATQEDDATVSEVEWSRYHGNLARSGVFGGPGDNNLRVVVDPTGVRQLTVYAGQGTVFGYSYTLDDNLAINLDANTGATRYDVVVLRYDASVDDESRISVQVVKGASGSGAPAVQRNGTSTGGQFDIKLATVTVATNVGSLAASAVSDDREFSGASVVAFPDMAHFDATRLQRGDLVTIVSPAALYTWTGTGLADAVQRPQLPVQINGASTAVASGDPTAPLGTFTAERSGTVLFTYTVEVIASTNNRVYAGLLVDGVEIGGSTVAGQYGFLTFVGLRSIPAGTHTLATRYFANTGTSQILNPRVVVQFF